MAIVAQQNLVERAIVRPSNGVNALVGKLGVVHVENLPLSSGLANPNAALKIAGDRLQVLNQRLLLGVDSRHQSLR